MEEDYYFQGSMFIHHVSALANKMFGAAGTLTKMTGAPRGQVGVLVGLEKQCQRASWSLHRNVSPWVHLITGTIHPGCPSTAAWQDSHIQATSLHYTIHCKTVDIHSAADLSFPISLPQTSPSMSSVGG